MLYSITANYFIHLYGKFPLFEWTEAAAAAAAKEKAYDTFTTTIFRYYFIKHIANSLG